MPDLDRNIPMIPKIEPKVVVSILAEVEDYNHRLMNIPGMWKRTMGEGVTISIVDTGVPKHNDLMPGISKSFVSGYLEDKNGHGCVAPDTLVHTTYSGISRIDELYDNITASEITVELPYSKQKSFVKDVSSLNILTYALDTEPDDTTSSRPNKTAIAPLQYIHKTHIDSEVVDITLEGNIKYSLTPWHPVYLRKRSPGGHTYSIVRTRADQLHPGDHMIYASGDNAGELVKKYKTILGTPIRICENCGHIPAQYKTRTGPCNCKKCFKYKWRESNEMYELTPDIAYLCGIVITDGHIVNNRRRRVEVTSSTPEILENVIKLCERNGFSAKFNQQKNRTGRVLIYSKSCVDLLVNIGVFDKNKTYTQTLPSIISNSPKDVIYSFLAGILDGDGCISKNNVKNRITTASPDLAYGLAALLNSIGVSCGVRTDVNSGGFSGIVSDGGVPVFNCTFSEVPQGIAELIHHPERRARALRRAEGGSRGIRRIARIGTSRFEGYYYDFTVAKYGTFLANGHFVSNTHAAGIIAATAFNGMGVRGIAPDVNDIYAVALDHNGTGNINSVIDSIYWSVENGADIINLSLGLPQGTQNPKALEKACNFAYNNNVTVFAASGNEGADVTYPARYDSVIAIAAVDSKKSRAKFSNYGSQVEFAAGGVDVYSTYLNNSYAKLSGTSMACPAVAAAAALILSDARLGGRNLTPDEIRLKLRKIAFDIGNDRHDKYTGYGIPIFQQYDSDTSLVKVKRHWLLKLLDIILRRRS